MKTEIVKKQAEEVSDQVLSLKITDEKTMTEATELLSRISKQADAITTEKEKVTKPINAALLAERKRWKPMEDSLKKAGEYLRKQMSVYQTAMLKAADAEKEKIAARVGVGKGNFKIETAAAKMNQVIVPEAKVSGVSGSVSFTDDYDITVVNAQEVPAKFLEVKISDIKKALKAGETVPGITFEMIKVPINRRN